MRAPEPLDRGRPAAPSITPPREPRRLQRSRRKGTRSVDGAIYVGRPSLFGNPFDFRRFGHARSVKLFARWLAGRLGDLTLERLGFCPAEVDALHRRRALMIQRLPLISGRDLQCWCPLTSRWCHADVLLQRARFIPAAVEVPY